MADVRQPRIVSVRRAPQRAGVVAECRRGAMGIRCGSLRMKTSCWRVMWKMFTITQVDIVAVTETSCFTKDSISEARTENAEFPTRRCAVDRPAC